MEEIILQTDEQLLFQPGEVLTPSGGEPLLIRYAPLKLPLVGESRQARLLNAVKTYLQLAVPTGWTVETAKHIRQRMENAAPPLVEVMTNRLTWKRSAKGREFCEHEINVVVTGELDTDATVNLLDEWARLFIDGAGPLDDFPCMQAETLDEAESGYSIDELTNTPSRFYGGLKLTFWED